MGQYTPVYQLYQKMGAIFRLLKPKGQEQEREHIQQKKTMMFSEFWLHFNIVIIFVMTLFNILSDFFTEIFTEIQLQNQNYYSCISNKNVV